jgi:ubiquinone/menaquinone biosynthesis C-methylase UbiE
MIALATMRTRKPLPTPPARRRPPRQGTDRFTEGEALAARPRWASADLARIGATPPIVGELLCEAVDLRASERVLDVAAGNGSTSLAAARRYAEVTGVDPVPALLGEASRRAEAEGLSIAVRLADAEDLPFEAGAFDVVLSTSGLTAPNYRRAAAEMLRVVRPGGRIGLASWTPDGVMGEILRAVARAVGAPGLPAPPASGIEPRLVELFGPRATNIRTQRRQYVFRYRSADHWIDAFRRSHGLLNGAFAALDEERCAELRAFLAALLERFNRCDRGTLVVPAEYLEAVVTT